MFELQIDHSGALGRVTSTCPDHVEAGSISRWTLSFENAKLLERGSREEAAGLAEAGLRILQQRLPEGFSLRLKGAR